MFNQIRWPFQVPMTHNISNDYGSGSTLQICLNSSTEILSKRKKLPSVSSYTGSKNLKHLNPSLKTTLGSQNSGSDTVCKTQIV